MYPLPLITVATFVCVGRLETVVVEAAVIPSVKDEFFNLIAKGEFVDKSDFITDVTLGAGQVSHITRPSGWGKTVNLKMLRRFLEKETDETGRPLPEEKRIGRKLFVGGSIDVGDFRGKKIAELKPLKIAEREEAMELQGRFAVIYVPFADIVGDTYNDIVVKTRRVLALLFDRYAYVRGNLTEKDQTLFDSYRAGNVDAGLAEEGLSTLSRFVRSRYGKDVCIFIDDYDRPLNHLFARLVDKTKGDDTAAVFRKAYASDEFNKTFGFLQRTLDKCLKSNDALYKGLLTGTLDVQLASFVGLLDNAVPYGLLDIRFQEWFGFTEDELSDLLKRRFRRTLNDGKMKALKTEIREWYAYNYTGAAVYNCRSVARLLDNNETEFLPYWNDDVPFMSDVLTSDRMQTAVQTLARGEHIPSNMRNKVRYDHLLDDYTVLLFAGYIGPFSNFPVGRPAWGLYAPNRQTRDVLKSKIRDWVCRKMLITLPDFYLIVHHLAAFEVGNFTERFRRFLIDLPADTTTTDDRHPDDVYYDGFINSVVYTMEQDYTTVTDKRNDRTNVTLLAKPGKGDSAIFLRCAKTKDVPTSKEQAEVGLERLNEQSSDEIQKLDYIRHILKVSMAFHGSHVEVRHKISVNRRF